MLLFLPLCRVNKTAALFFFPPSVCNKESHSPFPFSPPPSGKENEKPPFLPLSLFLMWSRIAGKERQIFPSRATRRDTNLVSKKRGLVGGISDSPPQTNKTEQYPPLPPKEKRSTSPSGLGKKSSIMPERPPFSPLRTRRVIPITPDYQKLSRPPLPLFLRLAVSDGSASFSPCLSLSWLRRCRRRRSRPPFFFFSPRGIQHSVSPGVALFFSVPKRGGNPFSAESIGGSSGSPLLLFFPCGKDKEARSA